MTRFTVHRDVPAAISRFEKPTQLGFGQVLAPILYRVDYQQGEWGTGQLLPYGPIPLDPAAKVLHYAQGLFEGLKAYRVEQTRAALFRPRKNWERMRASTRRMLMPELPEELFMDGLFAVTAHCESMIPRESGQSLYLRPLMIGTQPGLGLAPSSSYSFIVIASPSDAFAPGPISVLIERSRARAAAGGIGDVKVGANYSASLYCTVQAAKQGFNQPLWLDAATHRYIEELSVMNFFAVIDGELHTPVLSGTILPGVTRDSVMALGRARGLTVRERQMDINELLNLIKSGHCVETFACGTAVVLASISAIGDSNGEIFEFDAASETIAGQLRQDLLDIQEGRAEDRNDWMQSIPTDYYPDDSS
jgi:branched-chain amino acid aminotransferase